MTKKDNLTPDPNTVVDVGPSATLKGTYKLTRAYDPEHAGFDRNVTILRNLINDRSNLKELEYLHEKEALNLLFDELEAAIAYRAKIVLDAFWEREKE